MARLLVSLLCFLLLCCNTNKIDKKLKQTNATTLPSSYAKNFSITHHKKYKTIQISTPWPGSTDTLTYVLLAREKQIPKTLPKNNGIIRTPVRRCIGFSTTLIPYIEALEATDKLVGFANVAYIQSEKTKQRIAAKKIMDIGIAPSINLEKTLGLQPDLAIGYNLKGSDKNLSMLKKATIPVFTDASWTEKHPLGRTEWIKAFGALFNKEKQADSLFKAIEKQYNDIKNQVHTSGKKPSCIAGSMYKDIWYMPAGESYMAKLLADAAIDYLWKKTKNTGSISLSFERVLEKAKDADYWIGASYFSSKKQLLQSLKGYQEFSAVHKGNTYAYKQKENAKGVLFFELAPLRPDLVLKDLAFIAHPDIFKDHVPFFYKKLE